MNLRCKKVEPTIVEDKQPEQELIKGRADKLQGLKVLDRIQLPEKKKDAPVASSDTQKDNKGKRPRKRIASEGQQGTQQGGGQQQGGAPKGRGRQCSRSAAEDQRLPGYKKPSLLKKRFRIR